MTMDSGVLYAYLALGAQAILPIVVGSFGGVKTPRWIRKSLHERHIASIPSHLRIIDPDNPSSYTSSDPSHAPPSLSSLDSSEDDLDSDLEERLTLTDSLLFPIIGSFTLGSLYLLFKYGGTEWVNRILSVYFAFAGVAAFQSTASGLVDGLMKVCGVKRGYRYHLRLEKGFKQISHISFTKTSLFILPLSITLPVLYIAFDKPWYLTNVLSFSFSTSSISLLKLDGFLSGGALLTGLFFYDIFWVFGTPVMVTVAKGLDAPIKVLAPRNISDPGAGFSMLGLGDIVIPGIFVALALRFDYASHVQRMIKKNPDALPTKEEGYPKPYFWTVLAAYVGGLVTTVVVMHRFQAAQPALLYLSPACILSVLSLALIRGELNLIFKWSDEEPEEKKTDNATKTSIISTIIDGHDDGLPDALIDSLYNSAAASRKHCQRGGHEQEQKEVEQAEEDDGDWMKLDQDSDLGHEKKGKKKNTKSAGKKSPK